jgi:hypothetical protein
MKSMKKNSIRYERENSDFSGQYLKGDLGADGGII